MRESIEKLLKQWDSPETTGEVLRRGIDLWKWRCYALAAGAVDGKKWSGAEIARDRKLSRARICVVLKEVARKLTEEVNPDRQRLYRRGHYLFLQKYEPINAITVQEFFRISGGRHEKIEWRCNPSDEPVIFVADGKNWVFDDASEWDDPHFFSWMKNRKFAIIWCSEIDENEEVLGKRFDSIGSLLHYNSPLLINCGERFYTMDVIKRISDKTFIYLRPVEFKILGDKTS